MSFSYIIPSIEISFGTEKICVNVTTICRLVVKLYSYSFYVFLVKIYYIRDILTIIIDKVDFATIHYSNSNYIFTSV